jgi:hypothetical protein
MMIGTAKCLICYRSQARKTMTIVSGDIVAGIFGVRVKVRVGLGVRFGIVTIIRQIRGRCGVMSSLGIKIVLNISYTWDLSIAVVKGVSGPARSINMSVAIGITFIETACSASSIVGGFLWQRVVCTQNARQRRKRRRRTQCCQGKGCGKACNLCFGTACSVLSNSLVCTSEKKENSNIEP